MVTDANKGPKFGTLKPEWNYANDYITSAAVRPMLKLCF